MKKIGVSALLIFTLYACNSERKVESWEQYTYLKVCFEDYYLNNNLEITPLLNNFEHLLLKEGHLKDTTGKAYKTLFKQLEKDNYFQKPLSKENFNEIALYKNPANLNKCASELFNLDSVQITKTNFSKVSKRINRELSKEKDISIHFFFNQYRERLSDKEIRSPYIKQSIQLLLYRWYYKSKFEKELKPDSKEE